MLDIALFLASSFFVTEFVLGRESSPVTSSHVCFLLSGFIYYNGIFFMCGLSPFLREFRHSSIWIMCECSEFCKILQIG